MNFKYCYVRAVRGGTIDRGTINPTIAQRPETCPPASPITQWGTGFTPGGTATLHIFDESGAEVGTDTVTIRSDGSFEIIYTVPEDKPLGTYTWHAVDETTGGKSNTVTYHITEEAFPEISTVPQHGTVETVFEQIGTNFTPGGTATLYFFDDSGNSQGTQTVDIDSDGTFSIPYDPPDDKAVGRYYWYAIDDTTGSQALEAEYWIDPLSQDDSALPYFEFSHIDDQTVNQSFQITITFKDANGNIDTSFDGILSLTGSIGRVHPTSVNMSGGHAETSVSFFNAGTTRLNCYSNGMYGNSNYFAVTKTDGTECQGAIKGRIVDLRGDPVENANISRYNHNGERVGSIYATLKDGGFYIAFIDCGDYEFKIEKEGVSVKTGKITINSGYCLKLDEIELPINKGTIGTPVVLVPGMMGSSSTYKVTPYPRLSTEYPPDPNLHIHPYSISGWKQLRKYLEEHDDGNSFTVYECPWDWRLDCDAAYKEYLIPRIQIALLSSTTGKVHIVAHSMGGLVTRAYIQSEYYNNDIAKFAMIGTPNLGSSNVYYIWEGGDPKSIDDITDEGVLSGINAYSNTIERLWKETYNKPGWSNNYHKGIRSFVRSVAPSLRQLMETEAILTDDEITYWDVSTEGNENTWLKELNNDTVIWDRMTNIDDDSKVYVKVFAGKRNDTIAAIKTVSKSSRLFSDELYEDGRPASPLKKNVIMGDGDGTVPYDSAVFPVNDGWADLYTITSGNKHVDLMKDELIQEGVYNFLLGYSRLQAKSVSMRQLETNEDEPTVLSVYITDNMRLLITDPDGNSTGLDQQANEYIEMIPNSESVFTSEGGGISIDNPSDGTYVVSYFGEFKTDFHLEVSLMDEEETEFKSLHGFSPSQSSSFEILIDNSQENRISIIESVSTPTELQADLYLNGGNTRTRLKWNANTENDIAGYNIYGMSEGEPFYSKITTIDNRDITTFDTNDAWAGDNTIPAKTYAITAIKEDGSESFLSESVQNNDRDHDGVSDADEIVYGTDISELDTDGDGISDNEEIANGSNPLQSDSDGDGKSDLDEIQAGSDPLDDESLTPPTAASITANAGPDQTIKENTSVTLTATATNAQSPTYKWTQTSGPSVNLNNADTATPNFIAPEIGPDNQYLTFQLTVTDNTGATATDTCTVTVYNEGPGDENDDNGCFIQTAKH